MVVYKNKPEAPKKLNLSEEEKAKLPKSAMLGNFDPYYLYKEVITRQKGNGKPFEIRKEVKFQEPNIFLSRMCAFRHALNRAEPFGLMKQVALQVPVNLGQSAGFEIDDSFGFEIWIVSGESEEDTGLIWDSTNLLDSLSGATVESALFEMLLIPGANPANPDFNPA